MTVSTRSTAPSAFDLPTAEPPAARAHAFAHTRQSFTHGSGQESGLYSLQILAQQFPNVARLPVSLRIVLESVLRNCDGRKVTAEHVRQLAQWQPTAERTQEIPFVVARVLLQDFTGVPLLADLAAMRSAAVRLGLDPSRIEPLVPVDLVIDHSVMVDHYGAPDSIDLNMQLEFQRNKERYQFLKWGMQAFQTFGVVPPGVGIVHQVNLEYLARGVHGARLPGEQPVCYPDSLVGTDSHTTMINGLGVVAWGVGGIEAEAAMLGQPVYFLTPDVVGLELTGELREGVTTTDLVLRVTELLRKEKVVGKFVEYFGEGARTLAVPDRATLANMAPEYGATLGFFPVDDQTVEYLRDTGRSPQEVQTFEAYFRAQGLFGIPLAGQVDYSKVLRLDLAEVTPSLAGPGRPQDRIELGQVAQQFEALFAKPVTEGGFGHSAAVMATRRPLRHTDEASSGKTPMRPPMAAGAGRSEAQIDGITVGHGDVLIAAITSCTNTSNPGVMLAAGLLAQKAVDRGLRVPAHIKTSLAPGSRMVTDYLSRAGLLPALQTLGFALVGYGCTTCIGNSGDLTPELNEAIAESDLVCAAVLSGNRNFEARIHPSIKANFLASPPLVVAYALAGSVLKDLQSEPLGTGRDGQDVFLRDIWPSSQEVHALMGLALDGERYRASYARVQEEPGPLWTAVQGSTGQSYDWPGSTYIAEPPFFASFTQSPPAAGGEVAVRGARVMALFGDSITTDHISPAGSIKASSPAGQWLLAHGVGQADFNSYGSRRGHHEVMMRGTFANVRIKNLMLAPAPDGARVEGGITVYQQPGPHQGEVLSIFDAAMRYAQEQVPTVIFAGEEYGTGSSRDWAAKGTRLLGVRAVVARSFERIHRSNLVGMGVLPLQFLEGQSWQMLRLQGDERIDIELDPRWTPLSRATLRVTRTDGTSEEVTVILRIDTPIEVDYYQHGGILPFVLRQLLA